MGAAEELLVRPMSPEDKGAILALMEHSLGDGTLPRTREFWNWKHEANPFGRSPVLVATAGGQIVGLRVFMRWNWAAQGRVVRAVRAVDTATQPAFQGRGIFRRLTLALVEQVREEGVALIFNTPNDKSRPGYLKMGWQDVGRIPIWVKPLAVAKALMRSLRGGAPEVARRPEDTESLRELLAHPTLDRLLQARQGGRYETCRSHEYLRWRYLEAPGLNYAARIRTVNGGAAAVIYRRRTRGGRREATISEVLRTRGSRGLVAATTLLRSLGSELEVDYLAASAQTRTSEAASLLGAGFIPLGARGPWLTARRLNEVPLSVDRPRHWSWRTGDLELF